MPSDPNHGQSQSGASSSQGNENGIATLPQAHLPNGRHDRIGVENPPTPCTPKIHDEESSTGTMVSAGSERVEQYQGRPEGYPQLAEFMSYDSSFSTYRAFAYPRSRLLLQKGQKVIKLVERLDNLDREDAELENYLLRSRDYEIEHMGTERDELLDELDKELKGYDDLLLRTRSISLIDKPSQCDFESLANYLEAKRPLAPSDELPLTMQDDLISLVNQNHHESSFLDRVIECSLGRVTESIHSIDGVTQHYDKKRWLFRLLSQTIIVFLAMVMLMAPVLLLFLLKSSRVVKVIIVLVFVLVFPITVSLCTRAKEHDVFAATAA
ncbi:hypothetical protein K402DRAFT_463031 [Aulographum hederae CBS 113979]|uniref:DUF6594 domain-containing protein n=1 Tax=Aulographum hederae CBS 113979 TaxID=1176131 RepID=A0A6G1H290_9PEZI|nr:hypothetical protein K402DRAFT_463031 [Aulographum hederae CBS 113979]